MNPRTTKTIEDVSTPTKKEWKAELGEAVTPNHSDLVMKRMFNGIFLLVCVILLYKFGSILYNKKVAADLTKKNTACPTLLSISRSARDTLLVMRAEPLCDSYVLEHIQ